MSTKRQQKSERRKHTTRANLCSILLVLALPEERGYFHEVVKKRKGWECTSENSRYECFYNSQHGRIRVVVQTLEKMGQVDAVLGSTSGIAASTPMLAIMLGISGGLSPTVGLGDVVVSNKAKLYSSDKVMSLAPDHGMPPQYILCDASKVRPPGANGTVLVDSRDRFLDNSFLRYERHVVHSNSTDLIISSVELEIRKEVLTNLNSGVLPPRFQELPSSNRSREVHVGWILGSHEVVDSEEYKSYLMSKNGETVFDVHRQKGEPERVPWTKGDLLAVDMESYGLLRSAEMMSKAHAYYGGYEMLLGGLVVRGISDLCEGKAGMDVATGNAIRQLAIENATNVCLRLIEEIDYPDLFRRTVQ